MLTAYLDESYDERPSSRTFCVGGWIMMDDLWPKVESEWLTVIERERQYSIDRGLPPISRYHASDCSTFCDEFAREKGWDFDRQLEFSKSLLGIIVKHSPHGVVVGGSIDMFLKYFPDDNERWREAMYYVCMSLVVGELSEIRKFHYPHERISVFYDSGKLSTSSASRVYNSLKNDVANSDVSPYFFTIAPVKWQECLLLQPADLLAYEGMKRLNGSMTGAAIRKSFAMLLGEKVDIGVARLTDEYFQALQSAKVNEILAAMEDDGNECN